MDAEVRLARRLQAMHALCAQEEVAGCTVPDLEEADGRAVDGAAGLDSMSNGIGCAPLVCT